MPNISNYNFEVDTTENKSYQLNIKGKHLEDDLTVKTKLEINATFNPSTKVLSKKVSSKPIILPRRTFIVADSSDRAADISPYNNKIFYAISDVTITPSSNNFTIITIQAGNYFTYTIHRVSNAQAYSAGDRAYVSRDISSDGITWSNARWNANETYDTSTIRAYVSNFSMLVALDSNITYSSPNAYWRSNAPDYIFSGDATNKVYTVNHSCPFPRTFKLNFKDKVGLKNPTLNLLSCYNIYGHPLTQTSSEWSYATSNVTGYPGRCIRFGEAEGQGNNSSYTLNTMIKITNGMSVTNDSGRDYRGHPVGGGAMSAFASETYKVPTNGSGTFTVSTSRNSGSTSTPVGTIYWKQSTTTVKVNNTQIYSATNRSQSSPGGSSPSYPSYPDVYVEYYYFS